VKAGLPSVFHIIKWDERNSFASLDFILGVAVVSSQRECV